MTTIAIAVKGTTTVETAEDLAVAAAEQVVNFYKVRYNGTTRHLPIHPEGSDNYAFAVWVQSRRDAGQSMKAIAAEAFCSVSTIRRRLNSLLLAEDLETSDTEDVQDLIDIVAEASKASAPVPVVTETEATSAVVA